MRYTSEVDVKEVLGIESWRNLSKDTFLRFLAALPEMDKEVALQLIGQIPEITASAKAVLEDAAKAHDSLVDSNARSMEMVHQIDTAVLAILKDELDKDLTPEERLRVLEQIRDVHMRKHSKDTENKEFLAAQFDKRLGVALVVAAGVVAVVFGTAKSGGRPGGISRLAAA
jgi:hypothetical protein